MRRSRRWASGCYGYLKLFTDPFLPGLRDQSEKTTLRIEGLFVEQVD